MPSKVLQALLGAFVTLGFFGIMWIVATQVVPAENREAFLLLAGASGGGVQHRDQLRLRL